ncbi:MAG TPA: diacylglycerol kinase family protein [Chloroflexota bacterium]
MASQPPRLRRVVRSFGYALEGVSVMLRTQPNFLVHVTAAIAAIVLGIFVHLSPAELAIIVLTIALVMIVECLNTVLETVCDLVSPEYHPLVKRAKDISAAAVLIGATASVIIAVLLFAPHLAALFQV